MRAYLLATWCVVAAIDLSACTGPDPTSLVVAPPPLLYSYTRADFNSQTMSAEKAVAIAQVHLPGSDGMLVALDWQPARGFQPRFGTAQFSPPRQNPDAFAWLVTVVWQQSRQDGRFGRSEVMRLLGEEPPDVLPSASTASSLPLPIIPVPELSPAQALARARDALARESRAGAIVVGLDWYQSTGVTDGPDPAWREDARAREFDWFVTYLTNDSIERLRVGRNGATEVVSSSAVTVARRRRAGSGAAQHQP